MADTDGATAVPHDEAKAEVAAEETEATVGYLTDAQKTSLLKKCDYPTHPIAATQPQTSPADFVDLCNSIAAIGVQDKMELAKMPDGGWGLLEGNTRQRAIRFLIEEKGIDKAANGTGLLDDVYMKHTTTDTDELWQIVRARMTRRNLKPIQRAAVVVKMDKQREKLAKEAGKTLPKESYDERWARLCQESACNADHVQCCLRAAKKSSTFDILDSIAEGVLTAVDARKILDRREQGLKDVADEAELAAEKRMKSGDEYRDDDDRIVPDYLTSSFQTAKDLGKFKKDLEALSRRYAVIASQTGGEGMQSNLFKDLASEVKSHIKHVAPRIVCPKATKKNPCDSSCVKCNGFSYLSKAREEQLAADADGRKTDGKDETAPAEKKEKEKAEK